MTLRDCLAHRSRLSLIGRGLWTVWIVCASCPHGSVAQVLDQYVPQTGFDAPPTAADVREQAVIADKPQGLRAGSFDVQSDVTAGAGYDTNLDMIHNGRAGPTTLYTGLLTASSDWSRNSLYGRLSFDSSVYPTKTNRDRTDWTAILGGTIDVGHDKLRLTYDHLSLVETSEDIGASTVTTKLIPYSTDIAEVGYTDQWNSVISLSPDARVTDYRFSDVLTPAFPQGESFRNRVAVDESLTAAYTPTEGESLLLVGRGNEIRYTAIGPGEISPDSNGGSLLTGVDFTPGGPIRVRALAGYQIRLYTNTRLGHIYSPVVEASVEWKPTHRLVLELRAQREIEDSGASNIGGFTYTAGRLRSTYSIRHDIDLEAHMQVQHAGFEPTIFLPSNPVLQTAASQTIYNPGVSVEWRLNRHWRLLGAFDFNDHRAPGSGNYTRNVGLVSVRLDL